MSTKQCPDCAERVLAEARVCRFCGYRFAPPPARARGGSGSLVDIVRPPRAPAPSPGELLQSWDIELEDEEVVSIDVGVVDHVDGFVVITDRRILFVRHSDAALAWSHPLAGVTSVTEGGWLWRRSVRIQGPDTDFTIHAATKDLAANLERARR
jgi:hypothetical protein